MAFVVGSVLIGAGASIVGGAIGAKGAKDAASTAAAGSEREIGFARESRDIARGDQAPYRTAGYKALDKLGVMTGLQEEGESFGGGYEGGQGQALTAEGSPWGDSPWSLSYDNGYVASLDDGTTQYWNDNSQQWMSSRGSAYGGAGSGGGGQAIQSRAGGGPLYPPTGLAEGGPSSGVRRLQYSRAIGGNLYNVNELGPESVYSQGSYTRNGNPQTIPEDPSGYVKPNGRAVGGQLGAGRYSGTTMGTGASPVGYYDTTRDDRLQSGGATLSGADKDPRFQGYVPPTQREGGPVDQPVGRDPIYSGGTDPSGTPYQTYGGQVDAEGNRTGDLLPHQIPQYENGQFTGEMQGPVPGGYGGGPINDQLGPGMAAGSPLDTTMTAGQGGPQGGGTAVGGGQPIPQENPYNFETDPGYNFRFNEGQRMLERGAAARGGLLSGGFARKAIRYGQDYATGEFSNIYNRISNIAGLGQVSAGQSGNAAQYSGGQMGRAASEGGVSSAYGQQGSANAWAGAANQIAQLPWGDIFGKKGETP